MHQARARAGGDDASALACPLYTAVGDLAVIADGDDVEGDAVDVVVDAAAAVVGVAAAAAAQGSGRDMKHGSLVAVV